MTEPFDETSPVDATSASETESVLLRAGRPYSAVAVTDRPWGFYAGVALIAVVGFSLFSAMSSGRNARAATRVSGAQLPPAPARPAPLTGGTAAPATLSRPASGAPAESPEDAAARWRAPSMIVDLGTDPAGSTTPAANASTNGAASAGPAGRRSADSPDKLNNEERFAERIGTTPADTSVASRLVNTSLVAPQGTVIPAILETAINSDLPGFVRAVVSRDVKGFNGSTTVIPRGSKLIGQYRSGVAAGQSRAFVVWSRILTPDGVSVDIGSPAMDREGRGGINGETNSHFFQRFGASILLSVLSTGLDGFAASESRNNTSIMIGSPQQANSIASVALQKRIDIPDTVSVPQGEPIRVFVARDLDFTGVMKAAR